MIATLALLALTLAAQPTTDEHALELAERGMKPLPVATAADAGVADASTDTSTTVDVFVVPVASSTTSTSADTCADENERIKHLRGELEAIAALDDTDVIAGHWPALLLGTLCISAIAVFGDDLDLSNGEAVGLTSACGSLAFTLDWILEPK